MTEKDGGPAFGHGSPEHGGHPGMTLRDYFAGQALVGILSNPNFVGPFTEIEPPWERIAMDAMNAANAMLEARIRK